MIQRIQTLYMLFVAIFSAGLIFAFHLWTNSRGKIIYAIENLLYFYLFLSSAILALISIFLYRNRKAQFVICRFNILINLILLVIFLYRVLNLNKELPRVSETGIGIILPVLSIVLLVLAIKAIKKDEDLVRSVDRLR